MGRGPKPAKGKAKPAVARKSPTDEGAKVRDLEKRLAEALKDKAEALDQQTATSDILRVISRSPTDLQPVFDSIAASALRLCDAKLCTAFRFDGDLIHLVGSRHVSEEGAAAYRDAYPSRPGRQSGTHRAILTRTIVHIPDIREDAEYELRALARANDYGCVLSVPMLRDGHPVGAITVGREAARPFTNAQIELLQTFADQAVIAIENVRLFTELQERNKDLTESLEQQTATSGILKVISSSPTDVQPVFDTIVRSAVRLCSGIIAGVSLVRDGLLHHPANYGGSPEALAAIRKRFPRPLDMSCTAGIAILTRSVYEAPDVEDPSVLEFTREAGRILGVRSFISVPMLREGEAIGAITVTRREPGRLSEVEVALLRTFADQAVIAIENVRLFTELQEKNHALTQAHAQVTEALEQQTATSEVLKVISRLTFDLQPVLDNVVESATRLCAATRGHIFRFDGEFLRFAAAYGARPAFTDFLKQNPTPLSRGSISGRAAVEHRTIHVSDVLEDPDYEMGELVRQQGYRAVLAVPMLREGALLGVLALLRSQPEPFTDKQIELVTTFADQAVIAIENVRLFKELEVANRELAAASQHKSEFLANMSHELRTPLNAIIGFSEVLTDRMFGELNEKQEEYLKDIYASGTHLLSLINDILDLSKIEAGRMELELSEFDLPTALDNALMLVRERAQRRSLTLDKVVDAGVGQVQADERKIRQVALNLLSNAIKFTPEGGRIELVAIPKDGCVEVSVSDTGVGIAPEDQEKVFEEFRQVGTADKKAEGTGLGLTLCRKFIELHGGKIWVKSQPGAGSTFTFTIPVRHGE